jgi:hypothetical protein
VAARAAPLRDRRAAQRVIRTSALAAYAAVGCLGAARSIVLPLSAAARRTLPPTCPLTQAERSPEAAAFIEMYELAAEAKAFKDRQPNPFTAEGLSFWTPRFLRLARCHLHIPAGLAGRAGALDLETEAYTHLVGMHCMSYGPAVLHGGDRAISDALGRMLEDDAFDLLGVLARLVVGGAPTEIKLDAGLFGGVLARLQQPGVRAGVRAQLAAAQAGVPPARRLTCEQLELLFAKTATIFGINPAARRAARRCGANRVEQLLAVCIDARFSTDVGPFSCVLRPKLALRLQRTNSRCLGALPPPSAPHRAATELLQRLRPDEPYMLVVLAMYLVDERDAVGSFGAMHDAIAAARRQRSPFFEAHAGYMLASAAARYMANAPAGARLDVPWARPSAILECLRRADAARRRCKAVLPTEWVALLTALKAPTHALRPWLERCQRQGDVLLPAGAPPDASALRALLGDRASTCSGCGERSSQLRACPCKKASYCRCVGRECHCVCVRASVVRQCGWSSLCPVESIGIRWACARHAHAVTTPFRPLPQPAAAPPARRPTGRSTSRSAARRARAASRNGGRRPGRWQAALPLRAAAAAAAAGPGARALVPKGAAEGFEPAGVARIVACGQGWNVSLQATNHLAALGASSSGQHVSSLALSAYCAPPSRAVQLAQPPRGVRQRLRSGPRAVGHGVGAVIAWSARAASGRPRRQRKLHGPRPPVG